MMEVGRTPGMCVFISGTIRNGSKWEMTLMVRLQGTRVVILSHCRLMEVL